MSRTMLNLVRMFKLKQKKDFTKVTTMTDVLARLTESQRTLMDGLNSKHVNVGMKCRLCGMNRGGHA